eukprot:CAMPEP_0202840194 /NCGR_PEP_ID=MMETSP1389-20130828/55023_1 /ASSEMBLY_ACC=CAM_ASM_000865 /TAXON_ID=302021 /ORGANISM="Rhodomonas sp., Strain CCMP768" /LENGTH=76 /DNA_ID=CAMNT_0049516781 /DNA_START=165 /DNA_END=392 /DNA_ORIENTATION=-
MRDQKELSESSDGTEVPPDSPDSGSEPDPLPWSESSSRRSPLFSLSTLASDSLGDLSSGASPLSPLFCRAPDLVFG